MKHEVSKLSDTQVKITVDVDKDRWVDAQNKAFEKVASHVSVPGFRPGKAPKALLKEKVSQEAVFNEAIEKILTPVYGEVLMEEKISPFYRPGVEVTKLSDTELQVVFTVTLTPEVTLGEYKGISIPKNAPSVKDSEVEDSIKKLLEGNAELVLVDREAKLGDTVTLDFDGYLADEEGKLTPFDGGKAENYSLELGSGQFVPGFEDSLVGVKKDEPKDIKVTFPEHYVKELAGKEATFKILIHEIKEKVIPELTDEAVKELNIKEVETVEALRNHQKEELLKRKVAEEERAHYQALLDKIVEGSTFSIDHSIIHEEAHAMEENLKKQVTQNGLTFEQYLEITGSDEKTLFAQFETQGEKNIKTTLCLGKIAANEKLEVSDADLEAEAEKLSKQYSMPLEEVKKVMDPHRDEWRRNLIDTKIHDFLLANNK